MSETTPNPNYHGLVDIGSNGIRFSISDLTPPTARIMPTLFQDRLGISLYDEQFHNDKRTPIPRKIIEEITKSLVRFKHICHSFGVPDENINAVATEATRTAENSMEFRTAIETATGFKVELLSKADEGRLGSWGVASSLGEVTGLVMDLGGGSTQLSWIISEGGHMQMAAQPVSLPYGAAALTRRMGNTRDVDALRTELADGLRAAYASLDLPERLRNSKGLTLYLSGGGFRGFGYLLLAEHPIKPYPIPIINGFEESIEVMAGMANDTLPSQDSLASHFGISKRRASQLPAVSMLVRTVTSVLPNITQVTFCQGGVREGSLYLRLPQNIRSQDPLLVATLPFRSPAADRFKAILDASLPPSAPPAIRILTPAIANLITVYSNVPKETQATCGINSTTNGIFSGVHGMPHVERAMVALALCQRWHGDVADVGFRNRLSLLVGGELDFWSRYLGAVAGVVGTFYPAGNLLPGDLKLDIKALDSGERIEVDVRYGPRNSGLEKEIQEVKKVGKKSRCPHGWRKKITLVVR